MQKNCDLKYCIKCNIILTKENWEIYNQKYSHYICNFCRKIQNKKRYELNFIDHNKKQMIRYYAIKQEVINFYGGICAQCGLNEYKKLTIDHINGGGNIHRKELNIHIYNWLYNNPDYRDGYQILCYNCNCSKNIIYKDKYALRDKKIIIEHYGNFCADCGENKIERLTIDHKNNDGAKQRRELKCYTGSRMYRWLIKNNFPDNLGLQVLCYNCNCGKISEHT